MLIVLTLSCDHLHDVQRVLLVAVSTTSELNLWMDTTCLLDVQVCPLSVPKCYLAVKGAQKQYHKLMRFQEGQDLKTGKVSFEKVEPYMRRNSGFIAFHAALMQSDRPGNPVGLDSAWKYLARSASVAPCMPTYNNNNNNHNNNNINSNNNNNNYSCQPGLGALVDHFPHVPKAFRSV